jgi:predicted transcriptional regulator YheO
MLSGLRAGDCCFSEELIWWLEYLTYLSESDILSYWLARDFCKMPLLTLGIVALGARFATPIGTSWSLVSLLTICHKLTDNPVMKLSENELLLREGKKIVEALGKTLAPLVEVVLHDLTQPERAIVVIANNLSGRNVGDSVTEIGLARIKDPDFPEVVQNYPNRFPDGRPAKSTSIGLKNSQGRYVAAICLNIDVSMLSSAATSMAQLVKTDASPMQVNESLAPRRLDAVRSSLEDFAARHNTTPRTLTLSQRRAALKEIEMDGLLELKNAVAEAADTLGVARSTVYTYLA